MRYTDHNLFTMLTRIGEHAGIPVEQCPSHRQIMIRESTWPNLCFDVQLPEADFQGEIERLKQRIADGVSPAVCMFGSHSLTAEMREVMQQVASGAAQWTAMTLDVHNGQYYQVRNEWLEIIHVNTMEDLHDWCLIGNESLMGGAAISERLFLKLALDENFELLLARLDGKAVATCLSFYHNRTGGLYLVSTQPKFRGNGFGGIITSHAIRHLKTRGADLVHLQATASGESLYTRLGFEKHGHLDVFNLK